MFQENAVDQCLNIIKSILPSDWPIYWHCFPGNLIQYQKWAKQFSNLYISVEPKAANQKNTSTEQVIKEVPLQKILLETDAPLQIPSCYRTQLHLQDSPSSHPLSSNPYMVFDVADYVAHLRGASFKTICSQTLRNTKTFFHC